MGDRLGIPGAVGFSFSNICLCSSFYPPSFKLTTRSRINEINKQLFNDLLIDAFPYKAGQGRAGQGRAGHGRAGQGRAGQGRAGQGRAGQGRAGQGRAGQGRAGQGRAGQGRS